MQGFDISLIDVALVGSALISWLALAIALLALGRARRQAEITQKLYSRLNHELEMTASGSVGMGQKLIALERKMRAEKLAREQTGQAQTPVSESFEPYTAASQMLNSDVEPEEIAKRCGLSKAEVALMQLMQDAKVA